MEALNKPYHLFSSPKHYYDALLNDIRLATKYVYIETFRLGRDNIGEQFRNILTQKAKEGVEIKLLIDYWGARSLDTNYFKEFIDAGGEVRFFDKIKFNTTSLPKVTGEITVNYSLSMTKLLISVHPT